MPTTYKPTPRPDPVRAAAVELLDKLELLENIGMPHITSVRLSMDALREALEKKQ